jgi:hypothetical protein
VSVLILIVDKQLIMDGAVLVRPQRQHLGGIYRSLLHVPHLSDEERSRLKVRFFLVCWHELIN